MQSPSKILKKLRVFTNWFVVMCKLALNKAGFCKKKKGQSKYHDSKLPVISLAEAVDNYDMVLVHAGLRSIQADSVEHAAELLQSEFADSTTLAVPAFTPSFRRSGIFSIPFSRPEVGAYARLNQEMFEYRTGDPLHSLFVYGDRTGFKDTLDDTFNPDGIYRNFCREGCCWINVGTPELVAAPLHFIERVAEVPYIDLVEHEGIVYYDESCYKKINHVSYEYNISAKWNRKKIEKFLQKNGALTRGCWRGAICRVINGEKTFNLLMQRLNTDPYYLIY